MSNGTAAGTKLLADLRPGIFPVNSDPTLAEWQNTRLSNMVAFDNRLYFTLHDGTGGFELWTTDGTVEGTGLAVELIPGPLGGRPANLKVLDNQLYFTADTLDYGISDNQSGSGELFRLNERPRLPDKSFVLTPGQSLTYTLEGTDRNGDPLTYEIASPPNHGVASISVGGVLSYTANVGFEGLDVMLVRATDGQMVTPPATIRLSTLANPNRISFATASTTVAEQDQLVVLPVQLSQPATNLTSIPYTLSGSSVAANRNGASGLVTFLPGQQTAEILVSVLANDRYQPTNQQIIVQLAETQSLGLGTLSTHTITIVDDDSRPVVSFPDAWPTVIEDDVVIPVAVGLSNPSDQTVSVTVNFFSALGATINQDYIVDTPTTITFEPGQTRKLIPFRVKEDTLAEPRESVQAQLAALTNATSSQNPDRFRHLIFIQDDDTSTLSLSPTNQVSLEGSTVSVTLTRTGGNLAQSLAVPFQFISPQAVWGVDVTSPNGTSFFFPANVTQVTNQFHLVNDGVVDGFEAFTISLPSSNAYALGEQSEAWVGIFDANAMTPKITLERSSANEQNFGSINNRTVGVTVTLSSPSSTTVTIPIRVTDSNLSGYAQRNVDFTFDTSDLVFAPGQTSITRQLTILDDLISEPNERIRFTIGNSSTIANPADLTAEYTIEDNDRNLTITAPTSVTENVGSFNVVVGLDAPAQAPMSYRLTVGGTVRDFGSAAEVSFTGYDQQTGIVIFNTGEQYKTITVNVQNDIVPEPTKELSFSIDKAVGGNLVNLARHTVQLIDDDKRPTAQFGPASSFSLSQGDTMRIPIDLSGAPGVNATLKLALSGNAVLDRDYQIVGGVQPGTLSILIGPNDSSAFLEIKPLPVSSAPDKTITVSIVGAINIELPPRTPTTSRTLVGTKKVVPVRAPSSSSNIAFSSGSLAIDTSITSIVVPAGQPRPVANVNISNSNINIQPMTIALNVSSSGLLQGSQVFLDANFNGIRDYLDLNENLRHDEGEPIEPVAETSADGSFVFLFDEKFDLDQSGLFEADEGRLIVSGGIDTATGLPWRWNMAAPIGRYGITPISTLIEQVMRSGNLDVAAAVQRVTAALSVPGYSLTDNIALFEGLEGDVLAQQAYARQLQLSSLTILISSFAEGRGGNFDDTSRLVIERLATRILPATAVAQLSDRTLILGLLTAVNNQLESPATSGLLSDLSNVIASSLARIELVDSGNFSSSLEYLRALTKVKKVLHGPLAAAVDDVAGNPALLSNLLSDFSGSAFDARVSEQTIGDVIPAAVGIRNVRVQEGSAGHEPALIFEVQMVGEHSGPVSVAYSTADGTAISGQDYIATSGTLTWGPGDTTSRFITVYGIGDGLAEGDEYLQVKLSDPVGLSIRIADGTGYLLNDDLHSYPLPGGFGLNSIVLGHSADGLMLSENDQLISDVMLANPTAVEVTGQSQQFNAFALHVLDAQVREDHYLLHGSILSSDSLALYGSQLSSIVLGGLVGSQPTLALLDDLGRALRVSHTQLESIDSEVNQVGVIHYRVAADTTQVVLADASPGRLQIATPGAGQAFTFLIPSGDIWLVSFNPDLTVDQLGLGPEFTGDVHILAGGVELSTASVAGDAMVGSLVAELLTEDPLLLSGAVYELVSGQGSEGNALFTLEGTELKVAGSLASVAGQTVTIRLRATTDTGEVLEQVLELSIGQIDLNSPPTDILLSAQQVIENSPVGTVIGNLSAVDPDVGDVVQFALVDGAEDNALFEIYGQTLTLKGAVDYEQHGSYSVRIRATDQGGQSFIKSLPITVIDLPELVSTPVVGNGTNRSAVDRVELTFDGPLEIASGAFSVIRRQGGTAVPLVVSTHSQAGQTVVTLTFTGSLTRGPNRVLLDGYYQLTIDGTKLTRGGRQLDANGDGITGDSYVFGNRAEDRFFAYFGDSNGDGGVGVAEFAEFQSTFGLLPSNPAYKAWMDYDGGGVGVGDFAQFRLRFGKVLAF